ncbi:MAG: hypothetical protein Unbinned6805contig1000_28 [Prokaryotic dsDNA virus sp.]|nr:MAG: hypothetical protein Unbinned6805contig1000_28 [Prokaryotic dsDNA virus sp.]|tara:strand:- start:31844 stop:32254 length:411 start_codon:yes stop_codon:yes gene_type:complete
MIGKILMRVADSNSRVTQGSLYTVCNGKGQIIDDGGVLMKPSDNPDYWVTYTPTKTVTKQENKMLTIEEVTLVNGVSADKMDVDKFIVLISEERQRSMELFDLNIKSKAIDNLIKKHEKNADALTALLDKYHTVKV